MPPEVEPAEASKPDNVVENGPADAAAASNKVAETAQAVASKLAETEPTDGIAPTLEPAPKATASLSAAPIKLDSIVPTSAATSPDDNQSAELAAPKPLGEAPGLMGAATNPGTMMGGLLGALLGGLMGGPIGAIIGLLLGGLGGGMMGGALNDQQTVEGAARGDKLTVRNPERPSPAMTLNIDLGKEGKLVVHGKAKDDKFVMTDSQRIGEDGKPQRRVPFNPPETIAMEGDAIAVDKVEEKVKEVEARQPAPPVKPTPDKPTPGSRDKIASARGTARPSHGETKTRGERPVSNTTSEATVANATAAAATTTTVMTTGTGDAPALVDEIISVGQFKESKIAAKNGMMLLNVEAKTASGATRKFEFETTVKDHDVIVKKITDITDPKNKIPISPKDFKIGDGIGNSQAVADRQGGRATVLNLAGDDVLKLWNEAIEAQNKKSKAQSKTPASKATTDISKAGALKATGTTVPDGTGSFTVAFHKGNKRFFLQGGKVGEDSVELKTLVNSETFETWDLKKPVVLSAEDIGNKNLSNLSKSLNDKSTRLDPENLTARKTIRDAVPTPDSPRPDATPGIQRDAGEVAPPR